MNRSFSKKRHIQESNLILEQRRFNKLLESKMDDVKPLVSEQGDFEEKAKRLADKGLAKLGIESPFNRNSGTNQVPELPSTSIDSGSLSQSKLDLPYRKSKIDSLMTPEQEAEYERKIQKEKSDLQSLRNKINAETPLEKQIEILKNELVGKTVTFYLDPEEKNPIIVQGIKITDVKLEDALKITLEDIGVAAWYCDFSKTNNFTIHFESGSKSTYYQKMLSELLTKSICTTSRGGTPILKTGGFTQNRTDRPTDNMA
jgi:hypothetical protein